MYPSTLPGGFTLPEKWHRHHTDLSGIFVQCESTCERRHCGAVICVCMNWYCPMMCLLPPRGVAREEVANSCVFNFLLREGLIMYSEMCLEQLISYCALLAPFLSSIQSGLYLCESLEAIHRETTPLAVATGESKCFSSFFRTTTCAWICSKTVYLSLPLALAVFPSLLSHPLFPLLL